MMVPMIIGPYNLRAGEIGRKQTGRAKFRGHDGHAGEGLGDVEEHLRFENRSLASLGNLCHHLRSPA